MSVEASRHSWKIGQGSRLASLRRGPITLFGEPLDLSAATVACRIIDSAGAVTINWGAGSGDANGCLAYALGASPADTPGRYRVWWRFDLAGYERWTSVGYDELIITTIS